MFLLLGLLLLLLKHGFLLVGDTLNNLAGYTLALGIIQPGFLAQLHLFLRQFRHDGGTFRKELLEDTVCLGGIALAEDLLGLGLEDFHFFLVNLRGNSVGLFDFY